MKTINLSKELMKVWVKYYLKVNITPKDKKLLRDPNYSAQYTVG